MKMKMQILENYRFRKCTNIQWEYPYFEVPDENDDRILDVVMSDDGEKRIVIGDVATKYYIRFSTMQKIIAEGERLLDAEL